MKRVKFVFFASSLLLLTTLFSSCSRQTTQASSHRYDATSVSENVPTGTTWHTVSSDNCGYALITDGIIASSTLGRAATFPVIIEESNEHSGLYRIVNPMKGYSDSENSEAANFNLIIDATNPDRVVMERQTTGVTLRGSEIEIESTAAMHLRQGVPAIIVADAGLFGTCKDGEIRFPAGAFTVWLDGVKDNTLPQSEFRITLPHQVAVAEQRIDKSDYSLGVEYIARNKNKETTFIASTSR